jgi:uncharacterized surface protein with fasciclin (FAS1) repeats
MVRLLAALALAGLLGCASREPAPFAETPDAPPPTPPPSLLALLDSRPDLSSFRSLCAAAGIDWDAEDGVTVFAPSNEAFARVPPADLKRLLGDKDTARKVALFHVLKGSKRASELPQGAVDTRAGWKAVVSAKGTVLYFNEAMVVESNVLAADSIVHVIDRVLIPPL